MARAGVRGVGRLRRMLRRLPDDVTSEIREAMHTIGGMVLREMLRRVRRDTGLGAGELRMQVARDGLSIKVGIIGRRSWKKAFHLIFQEFGTVKITAHPFLWPAVEAVRPKIVPIMNAAVDRALKKAAART